MRFGNVPSLRGVIVSYRDFLRIRFTLARLLVPPRSHAERRIVAFQRAGINRIDQRCKCSVNPCDPVTVGHSGLLVLELVAAFINRVWVEACD